VVWIDDKKQLRRQKQEANSLPLLIVPSFNLKVGYPPSSGRVQRHFHILAEANAIALSKSSQQ